MQALQKVLFIGGLIGFVAAELAVFLVQQIASSAVGAATR
jgi:hypothetical protein